MVMYVDFEAPAGEAVENTCCTCWHFTTHHEPPESSSCLTFAEACQGLSLRQALKKPSALIALRFSSSSKRPSSNSVSALGSLEPTFPMDGGGDKHGDSSVFSRKASSTIVHGTVRGLFSRRLQSRQFRAFLKQAFKLHRARGGGSWGAAEGERSHSLQSGFPLITAAVLGGVTRASHRGHCTGRPGLCSLFAGTSDGCCSSVRLVGCERTTQRWLSCQRPAVYTRE